MGNNIFGRRLKMLRNHHFHMTQKEFAQFLSLQQPTISAYENGKVSPVITEAMDIAKKCGVSLDWLCGNQKNRYEKPRLQEKSVDNVILSVDKKTILLPVPLGSKVYQYTLDCMHQCLFQNARFERVFGEVPRKCGMLPCYTSINSISQ